MNRAERLQRMLELIDERLDAYTIEETAERLHSYKGAGPTVHEFYEGMHPITSLEIDRDESLDHEAMNDAPFPFELDPISKEAGSFDGVYIEVGNKPDFDQALHVPHAIYSHAITMGQNGLKVMQQTYLDALRPAGWVKTEAFDNPLVVRAAGYGRLENTAHHVLAASRCTAAYESYEYLPIFMDVDIRRDFSYPANGSFIMGNEYFVDGRAFDTVFLTDSQEGSETHEAA
jgi:hypothetical protein